MTQVAEPATDATTQERSTRDRILDVALDLFIEKGFDKTSLREIAEPLGITKAALYYHFSSKDDILMALHLRLHEFGRDALRAFGDKPATLARWRALLDELIGQMLAQRKIFLLHQRNQAAFEQLHREDHEADHEDIEAQFQKVLADTRVPVADRIRMACSFGAVFGGLFLSGEAFVATSDEELGLILSDVLSDVLQ